LSRTATRKRKRAVRMRSRRRKKKKRKTVLRKTRTRRQALLYPSRPSRSALRHRSIMRKTRPLPLVATKRTNRPLESLTPSSVLLIVCPFARPSLGWTPTYSGHFLDPIPNLWCR
jgi:hypothetical protein